MLVLLGIATYATAQSNQLSIPGADPTTIIRSGLGLGSMIAVAASWWRNQSVIWAIIHGLLGWIYVIYYVLTRGWND